MKISEINHLKTWLKSTNKASCNKTTQAIKGKLSMTLDK